MMKVSGKQKEMLAFIEDFVIANGYPPTYEEIRAGLEISSKSLVNHHLEALESADLLTRVPNTPRGIRLSNEAETVRVPFADTVGSGLPTGFVPMDNGEAIELTGDIVPDSSNLCAFKVKGDALLDALVNDGDVIILQPQAQVKNGEMVAVRLITHNETILKRFYRENGHVRLQPANPQAQSLIVPPEAVEVQGKVVAVIRQVD